MAELADTLVLYLRLIRARVRAQLQYRASFALDVLGMFLISFLDFVGILVLFTNVPRLGSWTVSEVALLYAMSTLAFSLTDLAIGHLDYLPRLIRDGNFDLILIRPRGTLFQVIAADFQLRRLGKTAQAMVVLGYAISTLPIEWTGARALVLVAGIATGTLIFTSVWIAAICIAFWTVDAQETANAFTYGGQTLAQFPIDIYDRWLRRFLAYVVPLAFVAYFPALFILGKADPLGFPAWLSFASPLVALAAAAVAWLVWQQAVRHYRSAGG